MGFNMSQIERAMQEAAGKADLLCFGEAFLQGFDSLCWDYEIDKDMAVSLGSETMERLKQWTVRYGIALLVGYIEKEEDRLYSSCVVIADGAILHNYRRISKGWKEYTRTDDHYREGDKTGTFCFQDQDIRIALCGDLWEAPERFQTDGLLIWPIYVNYTVEDWERGYLQEYAEQAALAAPDVLMVDPLDDDPKNHGGAFHFHDGTVQQRIPFDQEAMLIVDYKEDL